MTMKFSSRLFSLMALAIGSGLAHAGATVALTADASRPAANDTVDAVVYAELSGRDPGELAARINQDMREAIGVVRAQPEIKVRTGQQSTYPVYGNDRRLDGWRMRSELILSATDVGAMSALLGRLQQRKLVLGSLTQRPSPGVRQKVEEQATRDALAAFSQRAAVIADALGKTWKIKQLSVHEQGGAMPVMHRAAVMMADAAPAPIEAGESTIRVSVSGEIELSD